LSDVIFLNDEPNRSTETDPLKALHDTLAFSVDDWGSTRAMAWVWGIVCGWDEALPELADRFGWSDGAVAKLQFLHARFVELEGTDE
jgi:hypothetical protein